ncbi:hypothetical protein AAE478_007685 [Parahypoxylon ruwenzoriense]
MYAHTYQEERDSRDDFDKKIYEWMDKVEDAELGSSNDSAPPVPPKSELRGLKRRDSKGKADTKHEPSKKSRRKSFTIELDPKFVESFLAGMDMRRQSSIRSKGHSTRDHGDHQGSSRHREHREHR